MPGIFISYRRQDGQSAAGRLADGLKERLPAAGIFRDVETIEAGVDFVDAINAALQSCAVLLAVIGPRWTSLTDKAGRRRLDDPKDYTRLEVATALGRSDVRVIPVLVEGATMPTPDELPEDLKALSRRNAVELTDKRWDYDVAGLVATLGRALGVDAPAAMPRRRPWPWLVAAAALLVASVAGYLWFTPDGGGVVSPQSSPAAERVSVPGVVGMDAQDAVHLLTNLRLAALKEPSETDQAPAGQVVRQSPEADATLPVGGQVVLHVAAARVVVVPDLTGRTRREAEESLRGLGLMPGTAERIPSDQAAPDTVLRQDPAAGVRIAQGETVRLSLATPYAPVRVPNLMGLSLDRAKRDLEAAGLAGTRGRESARGSAQDRPNQVFAQDPGPDRQVKRGSTVKLDVWTSAVRLPNVIGYEAPRASEELRAFGLGTRSELAEIDRVKAGVVIGQSPEGGSEQAVDQVVTITVARARPSGSRAPAVSLSPQVLSILRNRNLLVRPTNAEVAATPFARATGAAARPLATRMARPTP